jgi:hypothetical protein
VSATWLKTFPIGKSTKSQNAADFDFWRAWRTCGLGVPKTQILRITGDLLFLKKHLGFCFFEIFPKDDASYIDRDWLNIKTHRATARNLNSSTNHTPAF